MCQAPELPHLKTKRNAFVASTENLNERTTMTPGKLDPRREEGTVRLTMETRDEILRTMAGAYRKATKREKGRILDHVVEVTGYNRVYASQPCFRGWFRSWNTTGNCLLILKPGKSFCLFRRQPSTGCWSDGRSGCGLRPAASRCQAGLHGDGHGCTKGSLAFYPPFLGGASASTSTLPERVKADGEPACGNVLKIALDAVTIRAEQHGQNGYTEPERGL